MKGNRIGYPEQASKIGSVQILTLLTTPEITVLIKRTMAFIGFYLFILFIKSSHNTFIGCKIFKKKLWSKVSLNKRSTFRSQERKIICCMSFFLHRTKGEMRIFQLRRNNGACTDQNNQSYLSIIFWWREPGKGRGNEAFASFLLKKAIVVPG